MYQKMLQGFGDYKHKLSLGVYTSSGEYDSRYPAQNTLDGSYGTAWLPPMRRPYNEYVIYKMSTLSNIKTVKICPANPDSAAYSTTFKVYLSETTTFESPIKTIQGVYTSPWTGQNTSQEIIIDNIPSNKINYIKIEVLTTSGTATFTTGIGEFQALGQMYT